MGCFDRIVVVDDASDLPLGDLPGDVTLLRQDMQQGAGAARNRALDAVITSHLLFFDSDDLLTAEFPILWRSLQGKSFDFCMFRHADSRVGRDGRYGQLWVDDMLWQQAGAQAQALAPLAAAGRAVLAQVANYPWNKIYRTGFLRAHDIRCSHSPVHNDIVLHWRSFLHGRAILTSDRVAARHHVTAGGARLTNRRGAERMVIFDVLAEVAEALDRERKQALTPQIEGLQATFWRFVSGLWGWVRGQVPPEMQAMFDDRARDFLLTYLTRPVFARLAQSDPVAARQLLWQMTPVERSAA